MTRIFGAFGRVLCFAVVLTLCSMDAWAAGVARAVFFSSPTCPWCATVAERDLTPLRSRHGDALELLTVDTSSPDGRVALEQLWDVHQVPPERRGVPTVLIGDRLLVGAREIPSELPALIDAQRQHGGDWPALPALQPLLEAGPSLTLRPRGVIDRIRADVPGNFIALALLALFLMILALSAREAPWQGRVREATPPGAKIGVALVGLGVSVYLTWGGLSGAELICGPVGHCNVVQLSSISMIFGVIPLASLGAAGYFALLVIYVAPRFLPEHLARYAPLAALVVTSFGFPFSIFLTFWQPFMIGATCSWCLVSALSMATSFVLGLDEGRGALREVMGRSR